MIFSLSFMVAAAALTFPLYGRAYRPRSWNQPSKTPHEIGVFLDQLIAREDDMRVKMWHTSPKVVSTVP